MARTQAVDYEERREAIVDEAAKLFAQHGFLGTSVSQLAKACGSSKSLLYHYYPSKEDVLYAVMASHIERLEELVGEVLDAGGAADKKLHRLLTLFMDEYITASSRQKVLLNELGQLPPDRRKSIISKQRKIIDAIQALLTEMKPGVSSGKSRARAITMLVFGMINWTSTWYKPSGELSPAEIADLAFAILVGDTQLTRSDQRD